MWSDMESNSDKIRDSPKTVLPPQHRRSSTKPRTSHSKPVRRDDLLNLNDGYLEIDFSRYRSASCKPIPSRTSGAKIDLKRTSVYQSSKELRRMKNPVAMAAIMEGRRKIEISTAAPLMEGRRKIEVSRSSDKSSCLSIVDSLCSSDEEGPRKNMEESERDMNKNTRFHCDEIVSRLNAGNSIRSNPRTMSKSLSTKLEFPDSPSTSESGRPSGKVRFSPIRKMFDPLIKSKSLRTSSAYSTENESKISRISAPMINKPEIKIEIELETNVATSPVHLHGILKFDDRNGTPSFEFSPNGNDDVFVAKNQTKDEAFKSLYTFHCLNGKKRRESESESTMVGKMNISFHINSELRNTGGFNSSLVMESVLHDTARPSNSSDIETAAVVIRVPYGSKSNNLESKNGNLSLFKKISKGMQRQAKEQLQKEDVSVIVPAGHHGLPETESPGPASLLDRWRGGGGCDCGGWDMGCPLTVFGNNLQSSVVDERLFKNINHRPLQLFLQGAKDKTAALTIKLIEEGHYSVDFHAQLSSLQAFSICVSMLHCAKTRTTFEKDSKELMQCSSLKMMIEEEVSFLLEEKKLPKKVEENPNPHSYVINPPFSPIARV